MRIIVKGLGGSIYFIDVVLCYRGKELIVSRCEEQAWHGMAEPVYVGRPAKILGGGGGWMEGERGR